MARNEARNPSCAVDTSLLLGSGITRLTGLSGPPRSTGARISVSTGPWTNSLSSGMATGAAAGETWSAVIWVRTSIARQIRIYFATWNGTSFVATQDTDRVDVTPAANTWTQYRLVQTIPAGTFTQLGVHIDFPASGSATTDVDVSSVRLEKVNDPAITYADGDTAGWDWDGTAGLSTSFEVEGPDYSDRTSQSFSDGTLSSTYHIYADGTDTGQEVGMMFQFHGDGAFEFDNPTNEYSLGGPRGLIAECKRRNIILVPVRTPDNDDTWWTDGSSNADYVKALIDQLDTEYSPDKLYLNGFSGGAQFIGQFLLPKYPSTFERGGNAIMFGGGDEPEVTPGTFSSTLKANFPLHWYTGEEDIAANSDESYDGLAASVGGRDYYQGQGFTVSLESPLNEVHDMQYRFGPATAAYFRATDNGPTVWQTEEDFESSTGMSSGTWIRTNTAINGNSPPSGSWALKTPGSPAHNTNHDAVFDVPDGAVGVRFKYYSRTEYDFDYFQLIAGSDTVRVDSGIYTFGYKDSVEYDVEGLSSITFRYATDPGTQPNNPGVWIDKVEFEFPYEAPDTEPGRYFLAI